MKLLQHKLGTDIAWTMGSLVILAASGILINIVIALFRDAAALGVFNLAYAVYIVASQLAVFGLHYSALRHGALHAEEPDVLGHVLSSAAACALVLGIAVGGAVYLAAPWLGAAFDSPRAGAAIAYAAIGLVLFPLNKVLVSFINGLRHMRCFALLQSGRYFLVMAWVTAIAATASPFELATLAFLVAELVTTVAAVIYLAQAGVLGSVAIRGEWVRRHFAFGAKSLLAGTFVELNSRVDVLLIGLFLSDRAVGIYSFAAMLYDGLYHVLAMIRVNFNPLLVTTVRDADWDGARRLLRQSKRYVYPVTLALAVATVAGFWLLATLVVPNKGLLEGTASLIILLTGLVAMAAFVPFDNLLVVSGHPSLQTLQHLVVVLTNVALNLALVPLLGIEGAALATVAAYGAGLTVLLVLARRLLGWNLMTNQVAGLGVR